MGRGSQGLRPFSFVGRIGGDSREPWGGTRVSGAHLMSKSAR
jgi:hypothetical protein